MSASPGFVGFGAAGRTFGIAGSGVLRSAGSGPTAAPSGRLDVLYSAQALVNPVFSGRDGDLSVCMKGLAKKAATTKVKALEDLAQLALSKDKEDLKLALPNWAFQYPMLAEHPVRQVRAAAHKAWGALVGRLRKASTALMPVLMPPLLWGTHDPARDAAAAATAAIESVFPGERRADALLFCGPASISVGMETAHRTPETIAERLQINAEEALETFERSTSTALQGLATLATAASRAVAAEGIPQSAPTGAAAASSGAAMPSADAADKAVKRRLHNANETLAELCQLCELESGGVLDLSHSSKLSRVRQSGCLLLVGLTQLDPESTPSIGWCRPVLTAALRCLGEHEPRPMLPAWQAAAAAVGTLAGTCIENGQITLVEISRLVEPRLSEACGTGMHGLIDLAAGMIAPFLTALPAAALLHGTAESFDGAFAVGSTGSGNRAAGGAASMAAAAADGDEHGEDAESGSAGKGRRRQPLHRRRTRKDSAPLYGAAAVVMPALWRSITSRCKAGDGVGARQLAVALTESTVVVAARATATDDDSLLSALRVSSSDASAGRVLATAALRACLAAACQLPPPRDLAAIAPVCAFDGSGAMDATEFGAPAGANLPCSLGQLSGALAAPLREAAATALQQLAAVTATRASRGELQAAARLGAVAQAAVAGVARGIENAAAALVHDVDASISGGGATSCLETVSAALQIVRAVPEAVQHAQPTAAGAVESALAAAASAAVTAALSLPFRWPGDGGAADDSAGAIAVVRAATRLTTALRSSPAKWAAAALPACAGAALEACERLAGPLSTLDAEALGGLVTAAAIATAMDVAETGDGFDSRLDVVARLHALVKEDVTASPLAAVHRCLPVLRPVLRCMEAVVDAGSAPALTALAAAKAGLLVGRLVTAFECLPGAAAAALDGASARALALAVTSESAAELRRLQLAHPALAGSAPAKAATALVGAVASLVVGTPAEATLSFGAELFSAACVPLLQPCLAELSPAVLEQVHACVAAFAAHALPASAVRLFQPAADHSTDVVCHRALERGRALLPDSGKALMAELLRQALSACATASSRAVGAQTLMCSAETAAIALCHFRATPPAEFGGPVSASDSDSLGTLAAAPYLPAVWCCEVLVASRGQAGSVAPPCAAVVLAIALDQARSAAAALPGSVPAAGLNPWTAGWEEHEAEARHDCAILQLRLMGDRWPAIQAAAEAVAAPGTRPGLLPLSADACLRVIAACLAVMHSHRHAPTASTDEPAASAADATALVAQIVRASHLAASTGLASPQAVFAALFASLATIHGPSDPACLCRELWRQRAVPEAVARAIPGSRDRHAGETLPESAGTAAAGASSAVAPPEHDDGVARAVAAVRVAGEAAIASDAALGAPGGGLSGVLSACGGSKLASGLVAAAAAAICMGSAPAASRVLAAAAACFARGEPVPDAIVSCLVTLSTDCSPLSALLDVSSGGLTAPDLLSCGAGASAAALAELMRSLLLACGGEGRSTQIAIRIGSAALSEPAGARGILDACVVADDSVARAENHLPVKLPVSDDGIPLAPPAQLISGLRLFAVLLATPRPSPMAFTGAVRLCIDVVDCVLGAGAGVLDWHLGQVEGGLLLHYCGQILATLRGAGHLVHHSLSAAFIDHEVRYDDTKGLSPSSLAAAAESGSGSDSLGADAAAVAAGETSSESRIVTLRHCLGVVVAAHDAALTDVSAGWFAQVAFALGSSLAQFAAFVRTADTQRKEARADGSAAADRTAAAVSGLSSAPVCQLALGSRLLPQPLLQVLHGVEDVAEAAAREAAEAATVDSLAAADSRADQVASAASGRGGSPGSKAEEASTAENWAKAASAASLLANADDSASVGSEGGASGLSLAAEAWLQEERAMLSPRREQTALLAWALAGRMVIESRLSPSLAAELVKHVAKVLPLGAALSLAAACGRTLDRVGGAGISPSQLHRSAQIVAAAWDFGIGHDATGDSAGGEGRQSRNRGARQPGGRHTAASATGTGKAEATIETVAWTAGTPFLPAVGGEAGMHVPWPVLGGGSAEALQLAAVVPPGWLEGDARAAGGDVSAYLRAGAVLDEERAVTAVEAVGGVACLLGRVELGDPLAGGLLADLQGSVLRPFAGAAGPSGRAAGSASAASTELSCSLAGRRLRVTQLLAAFHTCKAPVFPPPVTCTAWALANEALSTLTEAASTAVAAWSRRARSGSKPAQIATHFALDTFPRIRNASLQQLIRDTALQGWTKGPFVIRVRPATSSFTAVYEVDETQLELKVTLPDEFPLARVRLACSSRAGIDSSKWKRWEMQLIAQLAAHNGSFTDAMRMWKENLDKEFEGIEPCPICYSIVSVGGKSLPKMRCSVCRNTFHASCLYRWFQSSGDSKCPMCRSPFY